MLKKRLGDTIVGQNRALQNLEFGLNIKSEGFNIYAAGMPGTGKETAVKNYIDKIASDTPIPPYHLTYATLTISKTPTSPITWYCRQGKVQCWLKT